MHIYNYRIVCDRMNAIVRAEFKCIRSGLRKVHCGCRCACVCEIHGSRSGIKFPQDCRVPAWIGNGSIQCRAEHADALVSAGVHCRRAGRARSFRWSSGLNYFEIADVDGRQVVECVRRETIVRANRDRKESAAVVGDDGAVFLERVTNRFFFDRPVIRHDKTSV